MSNIIRGLCVIATVTVTLRNITKQNKIKISFDFALRCACIYCFFALTIVLVNAGLHINIL